MCLDQFPTVLMERLLNIRWAMTKTTMLHIVVVVVVVVVAHLILAIEVCTLLQIRIDSAFRNKYMLSRTSRHRSDCWPHVRTRQLLRYHARMCVIVAAASWGKLWAKGHRIGVGNSVLSGIDPFHLLLCYRYGYRHRPNPSFPAS
jgi:hypothetical protein